jgi:hypothetical protein
MALRFPERGASLRKRGAEKELMHIGRLRSHFLQEKKKGRFRHELFYTLLENMRERASGNRAHAA